MKWTRIQPTKDNLHQWFFVKYRPIVESGEDTERVYIKEVTEVDGKLHLSSECNSGIQKQSYGNPLSGYSTLHFEFCGPIQMPPDWKEIREKAYPTKQRY